MSMLRHPARWTLALVLCAVPAAARSQGPDDEALKRVIRAETDAFYARNADAWQAAWSHDAKATRTMVGNGSYSTVSGWDAFGPAMVQAIRTHPTPVAIRLQTDHYLVRSAGALAWVEYDQLITVPGDSVPYRSHEERALVKENGQWHIASQVTVDAGSFGAEPSAIEGALNATGYTLLRAKKVPDAIQVFKLGVQMFPQSWNAYDSLGQAYAAASDTTRAIENYEHSLALNPKNDNARKVLGQLRTAAR